MPRGKQVKDPIGYHCINILVQRAVASARRKANTRARKARWNDANREYISKTSKDLYQKKRVQRIAETTKYREEHREHLMAKQVKREKERRDTDPAYRAAILLRQRLRGALGRTNVKQETTMNLVGADADAVVAYLEEQWAEVDSYEIDHVFPFTLFDLSSTEQQMKVMNITNLQPLTKEENRQKWDKLPTKAMAAKVDRSCWPDGVTEDMLPDKYDGWATPLRM